MAGTASVYTEQSQETGLQSDLDALQQLNALDAIRDELRGRVSEVKLPGIVVVGNQSSGKSSVLESISRVPLPRGQNTVTRCPIQLSVRQGDPFAATVQRGAELTSPDAVSGAIKAKMNELCPAGRFSEDPVTVSIRQPSGPNLTLIDLPGLIAVFDNPNKAFIDSLVEDYLASGISGTQVKVGAITHGSCLGKRDSMNHSTCDAASLQSPYRVVFCSLAWPGMKQLHDSQ